MDRSGARVVVAVVAVLTVGCGARVAERAPAAPRALDLRDAVQLEAALVAGGLEGLAVDCYVAQAQRCEAQAQAADAAGRDFDDAGCRAPQRPAGALEPAACALQGDLDGDGAPDLVVTVRAADGARGLAVVEADGAATLFGAGTTTELPMVFEPDEPPQPDTLGPDLDWPVDLDLLEATAGRPCAQLAPPDRAGIYLSGGDAAALLVLGGDGWALWHCGF